MLKNKVERIILDADDTLWENNKIYMDAEEQLTKIIIQAGHQKENINKRFDMVEKKVVDELGYGSKNFVIILEELYKYYMNGHFTLESESQFRKIVQQFEEHPYRKPKIFPGVIDTIEILNKSYDLYILTKGNFEEQNSKLRLSGIADLVTECFIAEEKNDFYYRELLLEKNWDANKTCMVGNSPKSDINPALRQGMYAVYIPYEFTWKLDMEPIDRYADRYFEVKNIRELTKIF